MGYQCPVCSDPQADAVHLANHLAFTAIARGGDHEEWLDEHAPDWGQLDDEQLGERVTQYAETVEFPQLFEDTTDQLQDHDVPHQQGHTHQSERLNRQRSEQFDAETQAIIQRARELTRQRRNAGEEDDESES